MNIKNLFTDNDAVSPVIGVILMVAITVILAAVIGAFVLDLGGNQQSVPQASFDFDHDASASTVTVTVESGENIDSERLSTQWSAGSVSNDWNDKYSEVSAGKSVEVSSTSSGDTISVIWSSEGGDTSSTLAEFEVP